MSSGLECNDWDKKSKGKEDRVYSKDGSNLNLLEISAGKNFAFGFGYNYNKYSLELRVQTPREVLSEYIYWC